MIEKKAQVDMSTIIYTFIAVMVGVILFTAIAQLVGETTNTITVTNESYTSGVNGGSFYITNYKSISDVVIWNSTTGVVPSSNYTVTNNVVYNGGLAINISTDGADYESETWEVSGTAEPTSYISSSGGRSMASLITIFFALAIAGIALYPVYGSKLNELLGN